MNSIKLKYIIFALLIAIAGCRKDEKTDGLIIEEPIGDPTIEVVGGVTGLVINEDGGPISNATVRVYNKQVTTDENGIFYINNKGLRKIHSTVHVEKSGYFDGFKSFIPAIGKKSYLQFRLVTKGVATKILSSEGGVVDIEGGAELILPANGIVVKNGGITYSGDINVFTHWYDPTDPDLGNSMPGNLLGVTSNETETQLGTYGMIAVELESPDGVALQLAENARAMLKFPVPGSLNPPNSIALWSFDESDVIWVQEGAANLVDGSYLAEVSHFSFWNCDAPFPLVNIEGRIINGENPVSNFPITIKVDDLISGYGYTDSEGFFRGKIPKGENLVMILRHCGQTITTHELGPFEEDANVGDIEVELQNFVTVVKGKMVGCNFESLQSAYGLLRSGEEVQQVITPIANGTEADGTFSIVVAGCQNGNYSVQFIDPENIKSTGVIDISPDSEVNDLMDVRICDDLDEFIQFSVDGELASLITSADVYFSNDEKLIIRGGIEGDFESFDMDVFASSKGNYNPSSMLIQGTTVPSNPELGMRCGDHINNAFGCDQFEMTIISFNEYVSGTFSGTLVANRDTIEIGSIEPIEYFVEGSFRVKIDEAISTGEISGQFWIDENPDNTREDDENRATRSLGITLNQVAGSELRLFPTSLSSFDNAYKFTDLLPGTYIVRVRNGNNYEVVVKDVGSDDRDCDFEDNGNLLVTDELIISENESIQNVDLGFKLPTSVTINSLNFFGCSPDITIYSNIIGGLPPYTATLSDGQTTNTETNPFFKVTTGGSYTLEIVDAVGNISSTSIFVHDYNNLVRGRVWKDADGGIPNVFDSNDVHLDEIIVFLRNENGELVGETLSENGWYTFMNVSPGNYYIEIEAPGSLQILDQNTNVNNGNDINPDTGRSDVFLVGDCNSFVQIEIGLK